MNVPEQASSSYIKYIEYISSSFLEHQSFRIRFHSLVCSIKKPYTSSRENDTARRKIISCYFHPYLCITIGSKYRTIWFQRFDSYVSIFLSHHRMRRYRYIETMAHIITDNFSTTSLTSFIIYNWITIMTSCWWLRTQDRRAYWRINWSTCRTRSSTVYSSFISVFDSIVTARCWLTYWANTSTVYSGFNSIFDSIITGRYFTTCFREKFYP